MLIPILGLCLLSCEFAAAALTQRWGHAMAILPDPPTLIIQGGKTPSASNQLYTTASNNADTLILRLDQPFGPTPEFTTLTASPAGPDYAWHCLAPFAHSDGKWSLLSFGGDGAWTQALPNRADSVWTAILDPVAHTVAYTHQPTGWGNQPSRRINHACAHSLAGGTVYITGGRAGDDSDTVYDGVYAFDPATSAFTSLPALTKAVYHHVSLLLPNGTLLVLGGVERSPTTGTAALVPLDTAYTLDTTSAAPAWRTINIAGPVPAGRRGATAALISTSALFMFGGADAAFATVYDDGWTLDLDTGAWTQVTASGDGPSPRFDAASVLAGNNQVIVYGGYGLSAPAEADVHVISVTPGQQTTSVAAYAPPADGVIAVAGDSSGGAHAGGPSNAGVAGQDAGASGNGNDVGATGANVGTGSGNSGSGAPWTDEAGSTVQTVPGTISIPDATGAALSSHHALGLREIFGVAFGIAAALALFFILFALWVRRKRKREAAVDGQFNALMDDLEGGRHEKYANLPPDFAQPGERNSVRGRAYAALGRAADTLESAAAAGAEAYRVVSGGRHPSYRPVAGDDVDVIAERDIGDRDDTAPVYTQRNLGRSQTAYLRDHPTRRPTRTSTPNGRIRLVGPTPNVFDNPGSETSSLVPSRVPSGPWGTAGKSFETGNSYQRPSGVGFAGSGTALGQGGPDTHWASRPVTPMLADAPSGIVAATAAAAAALTGATVGVVAATLTGTRTAEPESRTSWHTAPTAQDIRAATPVGPASTPTHYPLTNDPFNSTTPTAMTHSGISPFPLQSSTAVLPVAVGLGAQLKGKQESIRRLGRGVAERVVRSASSGSRCTSVTESPHRKSLLLDELVDDFQDEPQGAPALARGNSLGTALRSLDSIGMARFELELSPPAQESSTGSTPRAGSSFGTVSAPGGRSRVTLPDGLELDEFGNDAASDEAAPGSPTESSTLLHGSRAPSPLGGIAAATEVVIAELRAESRTPEGINKTLPNTPHTPRTISPPVGKRSADRSPSFILPSTGHTVPFGTKPRTPSGRPLPSLPTSPTVRPSASPERGPPQSPPPPGPLPGLPVSPRVRPVSTDVFGQMQTRTTHAQAVSQNPAGTTPKQSFREALRPTPQSTPTGSPVRPSATTKPHRHVADFVASIEKRGKPSPHPTTSFGQLGSSRSRLAVPARARPVSSDSAVTTFSSASENSARGAVLGGAALGTAARATAQVLGPQNAGE